MLVRRSSGYSLAEMLIVCAVLAIAAAVALPSGHPAVEMQADTVADNVVQAIRFARQEAMRSGALRMVGCDKANNKLSVYVPDTDGLPLSMLKDPLRKTDYVVVPGQSFPSSGLALASCSFMFSDNKPAAMLAFDADGNPVRGTGDPKKQAMAMTGGTIVVGSGAVTRTIAIDVTGRVTLS